MIMMILFLIFVQLSILIHATCHKSCECYENSNKCKTCLDANSMIDFTQIQCTCNDGYFDSQQDQKIFRCQQKLQITSLMDNCFIHLALNAKSIVVNIETKTYFDNNSSQIYESFIFLNITNTTLTNSCLKQYKSELRMFNQDTNQYELFPKMYLILDEFDFKAIQIPFAELHSIIGRNKMSQLSNKLIQFSLDFQNNYNQVVRQHKWKTVLVNNAIEDNLKYDTLQNNQILDSSLNSDIIQGYPCFDKNCSEVRPNELKYNLGDVFFAKIIFKDIPIEKNNATLNDNQLSENDTSIPENLNEHKQNTESITNYATDIKKNRKIDQKGINFNKLNKIDSNYFNSQMVSSDLSLIKRINKVFFHSVLIKDDTNRFHDQTIISQIDYQQDGSLIALIPLQYLSQNLIIQINLQLNLSSQQPNEISPQIMSKQFIVSVTEPTEARTYILSQQTLTYFVILFFILIL